MFLNYNLGMKFSEILSTTMDAEKVSARRLEELVQDDCGMEINYRRISEFKSGKVVVSYEKAKEFAKVLNIDMNEEELLSALKEDRDEKKSEYYPISTVNVDVLKKNININLKNLTPVEMEREQAKRYVLDRVQELYGDENAFSRYVEDLIAYDLNRRILEKKEER